MIRQPTSLEQALAFHNAAIRGDNPPRYEGDPQAGWYRRRAVRQGPWLPVRIGLRSCVDDHGELTEPEVLEAHCLGERLDPIRIWLSCQPITKDDYDALVALHTSDDRMRATHAAVDLSKTPMRPRRT